MTVLKICTGRACTDHGSAYLFDRVAAETKVLKAEPCACLGACRDAVNVKVETKSKTTIYPEMTGPKIATLLKDIT